MLNKESLRAEATSGARLFCTALCAIPIIAWAAVVGAIVALRTPLGHYIPTLMYGFAESAMGIVMLVGAPIVFLWAWIHRRYDIDRVDTPAMRWWVPGIAALLVLVTTVMYFFFGADLRSVSRIKFTIDDQQVVWCGDVAPGVIDRLGVALDEADTGGQRKARRLIVVDNSGGAVAEVRTFIDRREQLGIQEVVAIGRCYSACALIWSAAPRAAIGINSAIGFHGAYKKGWGLPSSEIQDRGIDSYILATDRGFRKDLMDSWLSYGADEMAMLGVGDLKELGIKHTVLEQGTRPSDLCPQAL